MLAGLQDGKGRNDRHEDPREEVGHFLDGPPGEAVLRADRLARGDQREDAHHDQDGVAHPVLQVHGDVAVDGQLAQLHVAGEDDAAHHAEQEEQVMRAFDVEAALAGHGCWALRLAAVVPAVEQVEDGQQDRRGETADGEQALGHPEEGHAVQETEEERRVAERRQRAADVADQEDEEGHHVHLPPAPGVGAQHGPDHHHRGAGGADPGGEQGADQQHQRVDGRRAAQRAAHVDAARDGEQRPEQDDEGDVVDQHDVEERLQGLRAIGDQEGHGQEDGPGRGYLRVVPVPEVRRQQGKERDREQDAHEGQCAPERQHFAQCLRVVGYGHGGLLLIVLAVLARAAPAAAGRASSRTGSAPTAAK